MYQYGERCLISLMPYSIRMELLKNKLMEVYKLEVEYNESLKLSVDERKKILYKLSDVVQNFIKLQEQANLPNEELVELYIFAKQKRKELKLEDNLFNLNKEFLYGYNENHDQINEEINKRSIL